ncbi:MAG: S8 family serine peptidase, partial [Myxococcota bacterium]
VQAAGVDGTGVRVAVLDSGIDYLHADLGGSGDVAEYEANDVNVVEPGTFPTAKVVGGFDFVGEVWPDGPLQPDPDPLDFEGHGSHVADIIGGINGVAPGVELYGVKVCSAVSSSCSGVALIQGMDFAADPNGDGSTADHVDIINMSLGSNFGQPFDDDLAEAVENATKLGILTVASAGNGGDRPYVTGTPAAAESALSVAQTAVPSQSVDFMQVTAPEASVGLYLAPRQVWSGALTEVISGPVQYADGAGGNLDGCAAFTAGSLTGQIVMVDRGGCFFSDKIRNIEDAGGILGIIGLIAPGAPFSGGFGGGTPISIPGFMIDQASANILRAGGAEISFDPANGVSLAGSMVASSSRGPRNGDNLIKPEIGAPGASISLEAGTGTLRTPFGGTSGAAPMVSGAAALIKEQRPWAAPWLLKTLLMNNADTVVARDFTGVASEVTRIGAGEVNVNAAFNSKVIVLAYPGGIAEMSMGYEAVSRSRKVIRRRVEITNNEQFARTFDVVSRFSFADDADSNAIEIRHPSRVRVPAGDSKMINVRFIINGENLPTSSMSSGAVGNDPASLTATEFDGYISISDDIDSVDVPWHIIPRKSADVRGPRRLRLQDGTASIDLENVGVGPANNDAFTLLALSEELPETAPGSQAPTPDLRAVGVRTVAVPAGFCSGNESFLIEFAFNTWGALTHVLPVIFSADLDLDNDGTVDFSAVNGDFGAVLN